MPVELLTKQFEVAATPCGIAAYLRDPARYVNLNPYVTEVRDIRNQDGSVTFVAVERIKLMGPIHRTNLLRIEILSGTDEQVTYNVTTKGVSARIETQLAEFEGRTHVRDSIHLTVPALARKFALKQARFAQNHRAAALIELGPDLG